MQFINKHRLSILGLIIGGIGGYLYYYFIGCANGTCMITSNPIRSTLYGAMLGVFTINSLTK